MGRTVKYSDYESEYEENEYHHSQRQHATQRARIKQQARHAVRAQAEDDSDDWSPESTRLVNHFMWDSKTLKHRRVK